MRPLYHTLTNSLITKLASTQALTEVATKSLREPIYSCKAISRLIPKSYGSTLNGQFHVSVVTTDIDGPSNEHFLGGVYV